jgi:thioredoxin-like negative regulator of GroEL
MNAWLEPDCNVFKVSVNLTETGKEAHLMNAVTLLTLSAISYGAAPQACVYHFTASWCGPCQQMSPVVSRLAREGLPIRKVDVDQERALTQQFQIQSIPAFVLVINGREVSRVLGATTEQELRRLIARIPSVEPPQNPANPDPGVEDKVGHLCQQLELELRQHGQAGDKADLLRKAVAQYLEGTIKSCWTRTSEEEATSPESQPVAENLQAAVAIQVRRPIAPVDNGGAVESQELASHLGD